MMKTFFTVYCLIVFSILSILLANQVSAEYSGTLVSTSPGVLSGNITLTSAGPFGEDIKTLTVSVWFESDARARVIFRDATADRWEIPAETLSIPNIPPTSAPSSPRYSFTFTESPFSFKVTRISSGRVIFNTANTDSFNSLVYSPQYLQIGTTLPANANIYGLGERIAKWPLAQGPMYTIWGMDWGNPSPNNLYGHHPLYLSVEESGEAHIVVFRNSNMMDVFLNTNNTLTFKTVGGILDFYFILATDPLDAISEYTIVVGRPFLPPVWSMGWHQCRWGYGSLNNTRTVVENYDKYGIPLDVMWNDIDWMNEYVAFEYDPNNYPPTEMANFTSWLQSRHQWRVHIVDPNIPAILSHKPAGDPYLPYVNGLKEGIFTRHPMNDSVLFGKQWPSMNVVWPDWTNPDVISWWRDNFARMNANGNMPHGVWLDMNEPSTFCDGGEISSSCTGETSDGRYNLDPAAIAHAPYKSPIAYPPYTPGKAYNQNIESRGFRIGSHHYWGLHYNVKDMWGMMEQKATARAMELINNQRAFTLSRATFMGSGRYGAHWLGDNDSDWGSMAGSIASIFAMSLFGVVDVGADICGFGGNTNAELCARWTQLGALYPFSRNHNSIGSKSQEPYVFGEPYTTINRNSLLLRYSLLPHIYTQFFTSHVNGHPVWRATIYEFPTDSKAFTLDQQFFFGHALLGIPVLTEGALNVTGYLPAGNWFDFYTHQQYAPGMIMFNSSMDTNSVIPLVIRGNYIVPIQKPALTTYAQSFMPYTLIVALDPTGIASGHIVLDDGVSLDTYEKVMYTQTNFTAKFSSTSGMITSAPNIKNYNTINANVTSVVILGCTFFSSLSVTLTVDGVKSPLPLNVTVTAANAININDVSSQYGLFSFWSKVEIDVTGGSKRIASREE